MFSEWSLQFLAKKQTCFIVFYLTGNKSNFFLVFLSKIEYWSGRSLGCVIPLTPFLSVCLSLHHQRLLQLWGTNFWGFFLSSCSTTPVRYWKICVYVSVQFHLNNWLWCQIKIRAAEHEVEMWSKREAGFVFHSVLGLVLRTDTAVQMNFVKRQRYPNS